jgi:two-component system, cell cycle sensor histidine kinase and response regulator CckA
MTEEPLSLEAAALHLAPIGIICVSGRTGRYEFVNSEFARLIGRDEREILAGDPFEIWKTVTHPDDVDAEQEAVARLASGEIESFELDKRFVLPSGETRWVHVRCLGSRDQNQRLAAMTVFFTDLQQQRALAESRDRLEVQLRRSQKLEALGRLAGGVAHDFNNLLLIIMGYSEILRGALPVDSQLRQHVEPILQSAQRAAELTRQLLAYSHRQVLKPEAFDLNATIRHSQRLLAGLLGDRVELKTRLLAQQQVFFEPSQMEQVIMNLAINARDAMPSGGSFEFETHDVTVAAGEVFSLAPGSYVLLIVRDSGTGIPEQVLPHIFEPFFTTKEVGQGSGLGLSMVEGIVRQSGGAVSVTTSLGQGTTFKVYLPRARDAKPSARYAAAKAQPQSVAFETVLVCDDDDGVRKLLIDILEFRAYKILEARNGRHALEVVKAYGGPVHLLITDVVMPQLGGVELAQQLREILPNLSVLYLSGYPEQPEVLSLALDRRTKFLAKPFLPSELTSAVSSMLEVTAPGNDR